MQKLPQTTEELSNLVQLEIQSALRGFPSSVITSPEFTSFLECDLSTLHPDGMHVDPVGNIIPLDYAVVRSAIQKYQVAHQISGLMLNSVRLGDRILSFHEQCDQLLLLPSDFDILRSERDLILAAFLQWVQDFNLYIYEELFDEAGSVVFYSPESLRHFASSCDWAIVRGFSDGDADFRIGYGSQVESMYRCTSEVGDCLFQAAPMDRLQDLFAPENSSVFVGRQVCPVRING